jgi:hypothetical protein
MKFLTSNPLSILGEGVGVPFSILGEGDRGWGPIAIGSPMAPRKPAPPHRKLKAYQAFEFFLDKGGGTVFLYI